MTYNYDEITQKIFSFPERYGTPDQITGDGCWALAELGKEAWNLWREKYPVTKDSDGKYVNCANFSVDAKNGGLTRIGIVKEFAGFHFGDGACFDHVSFSYGTRFDGCTFGDYVSFKSSAFTAVSFLGAMFGRHACFEKTEFYLLPMKTTDFSGALFLDHANFSQASFYDDVLFLGTMFGTNTSFVGAKFTGTVDFDARSWSELKRQYNQVEFSWDVLESRAIQVGLSPEKFEYIDFGSAHFHLVSFQNRKFYQGVNFSDGMVEKDDGNRRSIRTYDVAQFDVVPKLAGCEFHQNTDFENARFPKPSGDKKAILAYRTLKQTFSQKQDVHNERFFAKLEMREEAARESGIKRFVFRCYEVLSDFGFSILRPLVFYLLTTLVAANLFLLIACHSANASEISSWRIAEYALVNASPLSSVNRKDFGIVELTDIQHLLWGLVLMVQKLLSLLFLFLEGLALRNLLKMK